MKVIEIGDIHGRDTWKYIVDKELKDLDTKKDKIVFIGDYLDSHDRSCNGLVQTRNYANIIKFKEEYPELVELLFGNHEFHYLRVCTSPYSGFQSVYSEGFRDMLEHHITIRDHKMVYATNGFLFSHAGISTVWCKSVGIDLTDISDVDLADQINDLFYYTPKVFDFTMGRNFDHYGDDTTQTPIWIRKHSLFQSAPSQFSQVVGHTPQPKINREIMQADPITLKENQLIFTDTIHKYGGKKDSQYLKIEFDDNREHDPIIEYKTL